MFWNCYNYKKARLIEAIKLLEEAIYNDNDKYMNHTIKYTNGLHKNYILKTSIFKNNYKMPLINFAARCNSVNCIKKLLKMGVDINIYDASGWLPIHHAAIYHESYKNQALFELLSYYPYVNINYLTVGGKNIKFNNVKMNTTHKSAYQLANHYLCYGSCEMIEKYIKNQNNFQQKQTQQKQTQQKQTQQKKKHSRKYNIANFYDGYSI